MPPIAPFARLFALLLCTVVLVGSTSRVAPAAVRTTIPRSAELEALMKAANASFEHDDLARAQKLYSKGWEISRAKKDTLNAACFLFGLGGTYLLSHRYNEALQAFTEARDAAIRANHHDLAVRVAVNRASLFRKINEKKSAEEAMREIHSLLPKDPPAWLLSQAGAIAADHSGSKGAAPYYLAAIDAAARTGDSSAEAAAWNHLGYLYMRDGHFDRADDALSRGFRIRFLQKSARAGASVLYFAMLRSEQGRHEEALGLLQSLSEPGNSDVRVAPFYIAYLKARSLAALSRHEEALEQYQRAIELAQDWRTGLLASDRFRVSADVGLQEIFEGFLQTGLARFRATGDIRVAQRMFGVAELNRAATLREKLQLDKLLPPEYWSTLERFRARSLAPAVPGQPAGAETERLRLRLAEEEAKLGYLGSFQKSHQITERSTPENVLPRLQARLSSGEALLSFHSAPGGTLRWAVTRDSFEMHVLAGKQELQNQISQYRAALPNDSEWRQKGLQLNGEILGGLSAPVVSKPSWILSAGEVVHEVPFATLPTSAGQHLIEQRVLRFVVGAGDMQEPAVRRFKRTFAAFADPVYNAADARWTGGATTGEHLELTRLPGSRTEADAAAAIWSNGAQVYSGLQVTRKAVRGTLESNPTTLHFATHVLGDAEVESVRIAMGLNASGTHEYLTPSDIAAWRSQLGLVVMSGCGSGTGKALPGAGLIGLSRSWLLAGAESVVATYWPIPDHEGAFFQDFYREILRSDVLDVSGSQVAAALRRAQLAALNAGGSRSRREYWGAFFVAGRH